MGASCEFWRPQSEAKPNLQARQGSIRRVNRCFVGSCHPEGDQEHDHRTLGEKVVSPSLGSIEDTLTVCEALVHRPILTQQVIAQVQRLAMIVEITAKVEGREPAQNRVPHAELLPLGTSVLQSRGWLEGRMV